MRRGVGLAALAGVLAVGTFLGGQGLKQQAFELGGEAADFQDHVANLGELASTVGQYAKFAAERPGQFASFAASPTCDLDAPVRPNELLSILREGMVKLATKHPVVAGRPARDLTNAIDGATAALRAAVEQRRQDCSPARDGNHETEPRRQAQRSPTAQWGPTENQPLGAKARLAAAMALVKSELGELAPENGLLVVMAAQETGPSYSGCRRPSRTGRFLDLIRPAVGDRDVGGPASS